MSAGFFILKSLTKNNNYYLIIITGNKLNFLYNVQ